MDMLGIWNSLKLIVKMRLECVSAATCKLLDANLMCQGKKQLTPDPTVILTKQPKILA